MTVSEQARRILAGAEVRKSANGWETQPRDKGRFGSRGGENERNDFANLADAIKNKSSFTVANKELEEIGFPFNKNGLGIRHLLNHRFRELYNRKENPIKDKEALDKYLSMMLMKVVESARNGKVRKQARPCTWICTKDGVAAIVKEDRGKFVITGFEDNQSRELAKDAILSGIERYGYAPEFLDLYAQVGALTNNFILSQAGNNVNGK